MAELDHNRLLNFTAEGDKATSFSAGVYQGGASAVVFSNRQLVAKFSWPRAFVYTLHLKMLEIAKAAPGTKIVFHFSTYNPELKKSEPKGSMVIGKDDKSICYFGVQVQGQPPMKFLLKTPMSFDTSDPMDDVARSQLMALSVAEILRSDFPMASMLTMVKRDPQQGRPGGGGGGGYNRGGSGGGSSGGGGSDIF